MLENRETERAGQMAALYLDEWADENGGRHVAEEWIPMDGALGALKEILPVTLVDVDGAGHSCGGCELSVDCFKLSRMERMDLRRMLGLPVRVGWDWRVKSLTEVCGRRR